MAGLKTRTQLQSLFKSGAKPSGEDFTDFINSVLNVNDDGIQKPVGADAPLKVLSHGAEENLLDFYTDEVNTWRLNQKPSGAADGLNLAVNGDSKLFIESGTGNIGFSTTTPTAKLHIQQLGSQHALRIDDEVSDTTPLIVDAGGQLGLGTETPDRKLHIQAGELQIIASHSDATADIATFYSLDQTKGLGIGSETLAAIGSASSNIQLVPQGTGQVLVSGNGLRVTSTSPSSFTGNLGIAGVKDAKIHLAIGDNDTGFKQQGDGKLAIFTNNAERLRIDAAGNVGIGLTNPGEKLEIAGNLNVSGTISGQNLVASGDMRLRGGGDSGRIWSGYEDGGPTLFFYDQDDIGGALAFRESPKGNDETKPEYEVKIVGKRGNIGIGTTNPGEKLEVAGNLKVTGSIAGNIHASQVNSGTLGVDRIPNLSANKLTTGTLSGDLSITGKLEVTGHVGIGATNPSAPLQIKATSDTSPNTNGLYIYNPTNSANQHAIISLRVAGTSAGDPFVSWDISGEAGWCMGIDNSDSNKLKIAYAWNALTSNTAMTWDASGNVGIGTTTPRTAFDTHKGLMSGAPNDYMKAQFSLSGGGTVTWASDRLKWTQRFIAISMERSVTCTGGHINIFQPTEDIPAADVYTGTARSVDDNGVLLQGWEALYAVHPVGTDQNISGFKIVRYTHTFNAPSNWILVAVRNADAGNNSVKLGTGVILYPNSASTNGSPIPVGVIMLWSGAADSIPGGWALCDGTSGTPNLSGRFVLGHGNGTGLTNRSKGQTGGAETCTLTVNQIPAHSHGVSDPTHAHAWSATRQLAGIDDNNNTSELSKGDRSSRDTMTKATNSVATGIRINNTGGSQAHNNMPPFYVLAYIMKL